MADIKAADVAKLRQQTGAGMMDAKKALIETQGDMEAAIDWLRSKGLSKAAKKSGRIASEGLIGVNVIAGSGIVVEVNSETDFVAKNANFQEMVTNISSIASNHEDIESLKQAEINGVSITDFVADKVAQIGENITLRRLKKIDGVHISSYVHNSVAPNMGKIAVLASHNANLIVSTFSL